MSCSGVGDHRKDFVLADSMRPSLAALGCVPSRVIAPRTMFCQPVSLSTFRPVALSVSGPHPRGFYQKVSPLRPLNPRSATRVIAHAKKNDEKTFLDAARDAAAGKPGLESDKIDADIRRRAQDAISAGRYRVTVGDVASRSGLSLSQAESTVKALAADSQATLAVSNDGEILYCFSPNFQDTIRSKSFKMRLESVAAGVQSVGAYLIRALYGTALIASITIVTTAFLVLASSSKDDRDRGSRSNSMSFSPRIFFNITDLLSIYDPYYYQRRQMYYYGRGPYSSSDVPRMSFVDAIFSFVFGDGNPNAEHERMRWEAVGEFIAARGGVVCAEELAPFMDVTAEQLNPRKRLESVVDESYVLPALIRFGGSPEVDASGRILYRFPALQRTGDTSAKKVTKDEDRQRLNYRISKWWDSVLESRWRMTAAQGAQLFGAVALGVANLVGVLWLSTALATPANAYVLLQNGLGWVPGAMPALQLYAISFFIIPMVRWVLYEARNAAIDARNAAKETAQQRVANPSRELREKMESAALKSEKQVITKEDAVYRSDKAVEEQVVDLEADTWERRLERRAQDKDLEERGWVPAPQRASSEAKIRSNIDRQ